MIRSVCVIAAVACLGLAATPTASAGGGEGDFFGGAFGAVFDAADDFATCATIDELREDYGDYYGVGEALDVAALLRDVARETAMPLVNETARAAGAEAARRADAAYEYAWHDLPPWEDDVEAYVEAQKCYVVHTVSPRLHPVICYAGPYPPGDPCYSLLRDFLVPQSRCVRGPPVYFTGWPYFVGVDVGRTYACDLEPPPLATIRVDLPPTPTRLEPPAPPLPEGLL